MSSHQVSSSDFGTSEGFGESLSPSLWFSTRPSLGGFWRSCIVGGLLIALFLAVLHRPGTEHPISCMLANFGQPEPELGKTGFFSSEHASTLFERQEVGVARGSALSEQSCQRKCGNVTVNYPFGLSPECAEDTPYLLSCEDRSGQISTLHTPSPEPGYWPYLNSVNLSVTGFYYPYVAGVQEITSFNFFDTGVQVLNISSNGTLLLNSTSFKGTSCSDSDVGNASLVFSPEGPYRIGANNLFFVVGCDSQGFYSSDRGEGNCGPNSCINQYYYDFCNVYDCCSLPISSTSSLNLSGQGISFQYFETCGFVSVLSPSTYQTVASSAIGVGTYGLEIVWGLPVNQTEYINCSALNVSYPDYACSDKAGCGITSVPAPSSFFGYYCYCSHEGYQGDGYKLGTGCQDINECTTPGLNYCAPDATCTNLDGSYNCSCESSLQKGNGFMTDAPNGIGTGCEYINFCTEGPNNCSKGAICEADDFGHFNCSCPDGLVGDGYVGGTGCKTSSGHVGLIAGVSAASAVVFALVNCFVCGYIYKRRKKGNGDGSFTRDFSRADFLREIQTAGDGTNTCRMFTYDELSKATDSFSKYNIVGSGGFGTVYEGTLGDGQKLAIKKSKHDLAGNVDDIKQFINEVTILSQLNHRNLVKLLGCCLETPVPTLIFEFISNGNVLEHLRSDIGVDKTGEVAAAGKAINYPVLDWSKRLKIAVGTAEGLAYLHSGTSPPIYHRDVKTANILLDHKYVAKVADFGLSKFVPLDVTHLSTAIKGTPGYLDPEYFDNYQITDKSDVYSFGVVLLELITGEKPVDFKRQPKDHNLALRCSRLWQHGRLLDIIDPVLGAFPNSNILESVLCVAKVALQCVERHREHRPTMIEVLEELKEIAREDGNINMDSPDPRQIYRASAIQQKKKSRGKKFKHVKFEGDIEVQPLTIEMSTSSSDFVVGTDSSSIDIPFSSTGSGTHYDDTSMEL